MEMEKTNNQNNSEKKNKVGGLKLSDFKFTAKL